MFAEIDEYLDEYDGEKAYEAAKKLASESEPDQVGLCCRLAHACYIRSNHCVKSVDKRRTILNEAYEACKKAYQLDEKSAEVLKWCCIITGSLAETAEGSEKIELGREFKGYLDEATKVAPDSSIYHMRGRLAYEVANMPQTEREAAFELLGTSSTFTFDEALDDLLKAEELNPGELDNLLYIAKCFFAKGNGPEARNYLMRMNENAAIDEADEVMLTEAKYLLSLVDRYGEESDEETAKEISVTGSDDEHEEEELIDSMEEADHSDSEEMPCA